MPKGYTNTTELENYMLKQIADDFKPQVDKWIEGVEAFIEKLTGRIFKAETTATSRYYDGNDSPELIIDDCIQITEVARGLDPYGNNFEVVSAGGEDGYHALPKNNAALEVPIRKLVLPSNYWMSGIGNQKVTAKWGWSAEPPKDIVTAATILTASIYKFGRAGVSSGIRSEKIGDYSVNFQTEDDLKEYERAMEILNTYKKHLL